MVKYVHRFLALVLAVGLCLLPVSVGAKGGHILLRKPEELTFGCIVRLMEGGIELAGCLENPENCSRFGDCAVRKAWESLQGTLDGALESITMEDLLRNKELFSAL